MLRVSCPREALHQAVQTVARGVTGRSMQPVQNNIYLEAVGTQLKLVATDLEVISLEALVDVNVVDEGAVTAPARLLQELVNSLPDSDVILEADEHQALAVHCASVNYTIRGLSAADFQMFPPMGEGINVVMPQSQLHAILSQTVFATSRDETRPILTGALFEFTNNALKVVATDTYRLAMRTAVIDLATEHPVSVIVSARALREVHHILNADSEDSVNIAVSANQIQFSMDNCRVSSRLIEGQFPNYQKVIPDSYERTLTVAVSQLEPALRRAALVARDDANRVVVRPSADSVQLTAKSPDVGNFEETVPGSLEGEPTEIAFNARYLLEVVDALDVENLVLQLSGPLNPGMVRMQGNDEYLYVLMPMQIT